MNKYDPLMLFLTNRLLQSFGIRITGKSGVVFLYHIKNYTNIKKESSLHIVRLTDDIGKAFEFLKMNYEDYKSQDFKNILDFTQYFVNACPYLTKQYIMSLEKCMTTNPYTYPELLDLLDKFIRTVKVGHTTFRTFDFVPLIMYPNLRESIVRTFFNTEDVNKQFIDLKLRNLKDIELPNKFSGSLVVSWIKQLSANQKLCGLFTESFVNYKTLQKPEHFPRYLIDKDFNTIKKEVITYYYEVFPQTEGYLQYLNDTIIVT